MKNINVKDYKCCFNPEYEEMLYIKEGHDASSYYWIMPVNVKNYENTADERNVEEARKKEISIPDMPVWDFLLKYFVEMFDEKLEENKCRLDLQKTNYRFYGSTWFQDSLEYNYYTFEQVEDIIRHIKCYIWQYREPVQKFYLDFIEYMQDMIAWSKENGYSFITIVGP